MTDVICGRGRLGQRVSALMVGQGRAPLPLRIDAQRGLIRADIAAPRAGVEQAVPNAIDSLLICLVPRHPDGGSGWFGLLAGLSAQVARGELKIGRALLVSSTAVYACHASGWVDAESPVTAIDARTAGLIEAEQLTRTLAPESVLIRLAGITGPGYERFDPVALSQQQPRHAIDVRAAAALISELALAPTPVPGTVLLTDGCIYWRGHGYPARADEPALQALALQHRLMLPSHIGRV